MQHKKKRLRNRHVIFSTPPAAYSILLVLLVVYYTSIELVGLVTSHLDKAAFGCHFLGDSNGCRIVFLFDTVRRFRQNDFNVARLGGVFANASVGTVGTTASGGGTVDLGVANDQFVRVVRQSLDLGIGHGVGEQVWAISRQCL